MDARAASRPVDQAVRLEVQDLIARYADAIDQDRLEEWPELFVEKCRYLVTSAESDAEGLPHGVIYADSRGMLRDRVSALRDANIYEPQRYRHVVGPIVVEAESETTVKARSHFLVVRTMHTGDTMLFASGIYRDRIDVSHVPCRFIERIVVTDSHKIDTLLAIPL
jgi:anthranilate 1,2-dioxygenase small subunit/terephthalate 1,2-dioxygenase oxygenase component beta subunit